MLDNWWSEKNQNIFNMDSAWFSNSCFSINTEFISSIKIFFWSCLLVSENSNKTLWFCSINWNLSGSKALEGAISLDKPWFLNSNFFNFICFIFSSKCQSLVFDLRWTTGFQNSKNLIPALKLCSWLAKSVKKAISIDIVWYFNSSFSTNTALTSSIKIWIDGWYY